MQQLHFVGFTTDRDGLIFSARKGSKSGGYVITVDGVLLAQIDQLVRMRDGAEPTDPSFPVPELPSPPPPPPSPKRQPRPESHLTPRAIQARLRAGQSLSDVAAEAGVGEDWVARFAAPILHERASIIDQAARMTANKLRVGPSYQPLATAVRWNLVDRSANLSDDEFDNAWSAFQRSDAAWVVRVSFVARNRIQHADWLVDVAGQRLSALNRQAGELGYVDAVRRPPEDGLPPGPVTRPVIGVVSTPSQLSKSEAKPSQAGPIELADPLPDEFFDDDELPSRHRRNSARRKPLPRSVPEPPPGRHPTTPEASTQVAPEDQMPPGVTVLTPRPAEAPGLGRRRRPLVADQRPERRQQSGADDVAEGLEAEHRAAEQRAAEQPAAAAGHSGASNGRAGSDGRSGSTGRANGRAGRRTSATSSSPGQSPWWSPGPERPKPASNGRRVRPAETSSAGSANESSRLAPVAGDKPGPSGEPASEAPANGRGNGEEPGRRRIRAAEQPAPPASDEGETPAGAYVPRLLRLAGGDPSPARSQPPTTVTISSSPIIRARAVPARRQEDVDPAAPPAEAAERVVIARDVDRDPADRRRRHRDYGDPDYGYPDPEPTGRSRRADTDPEPTGRSRRADTGPELTAPSRRAEPAPSGSMVTPTAKAATTPATAPLTASTPAEGPAASTLPPPIPSARVVDDWTPAERSTAHRGQRVVPEPLEWGDQPASPEITATHIKASIAAERAEAHTDEDDMVLTDEDRTVEEKRRRFFRRRRS